MIRTLGLLLLMTTSALADPVGITPCSEPVCQHINSVYGVKGVYTNDQINVNQWYYVVLEYLSEDDYQKTVLDICKGYESAHISLSNSAVFSLAKDDLQLISHSHYYSCKTANLMIPHWESVYN